MPEAAGLFLNWARLQDQAGTSRMQLCEARLPVDASERTKEKMLAASIGKWLRWQTGRGWRLVSDVTVGKSRPTLDVRRGLIDGSESREVTGLFEYRGTNAAAN